jgi:hypothetical protein
LGFKTMANFSKIALAMAAPAAVLAMSALPASALVYNFSGNFAPNGGIVNGSFDYNGNTQTFGAINITTPVFGQFVAVNYAGSTPSQVANLIFTFTQGTSVLAFQTSTALTESNVLGTPIALTGTRREDQVFAGGGIFRNFTGTVTPVPFEFSPVYGVALLGLGFGVSKIKNKFAKKAV